MLYIMYALYILYLILDQKKSKCQNSGKLNYYVKYRYFP